MRKPTHIAALLTLSALATLALAACGDLMPRSPGERLWRKRCAECHGLDASGNTPRYMGDPDADLLDDSWKAGGDRASIEQVVREGVFGEMPANDQLTAEEMRQLIDYLYSLRGETG
jgi:mono/diheme cytochrome c family protein